MSTSLLLNVCLALIAVAMSPSAAADTDAYLQHLRLAGISTPGGEPEIKEWGWEVCALLAKGLDPAKVRAQAIYNSGSGPQYGMTVEQADTIMRFAVSDLCTDKR